MPAAIIAAVVAAGATAYSAYSASNAPGGPANPNLAKSLTTEQQQIATWTKQLATETNPQKQSQLQAQIANTKLVLASQQNTLAQQAGQNPTTPIQPVIQTTTANNKGLIAFVIIGFLAVGYFLSKKK